ncbi:uncharacterized protein [Haliotis asinina]|uniref:uncharacterized protein n=1 Tax=Haliotis asinina TaxID=109174 RepID=UPI00353241C8
MFAVVLPLSLAVLVPVSKGSVRTDLLALDTVLQRMDRQMVSVERAVHKSCTSCDPSCEECFGNVIRRDLSKDLNELMDSFKTIPDNIVACNDEPKSLIWTSGNGLEFIVEDSSGSVTTITVGGVTDVQYNVDVGRLIYASSAGNIFTIRPDGSDPVLLVELGTQAFGIAVVSANTYFFASRQLRKYDNGVTTVINSAFSRGFFRLSYNPADRCVYFTAFTFSRALYRANSEGDVETVHQASIGGNGLSGIAIDVPAQEVYFTVHTPSTLSKYYLRTGVETFLRPLQSVFQDVFIEGDSLFIAFNGIGIIEEMSLVSGTTVRNISNVLCSLRRCMVSYERDMENKFETEGKLEWAKENQFEAEGKLEWATENQFETEGKFQGPRKISLKLGKA